MVAIAAVDTARAATDAVRIDAVLHLSPAHVHVVQEVVALLPVSVPPPETQPVAVPAVAQSRATVRIVCPAATTIRRPGSRHSLFCVWSAPHRLPGVAVVRKGNKKLGKASTEESGLVAPSAQIKLR